MLKTVLERRWTAWSVGELGVRLWFVWPCISVYQVGGPVVARRSDNFVAATGSTRMTALHVVRWTGILTAVALRWRVAVVLAWCLAVRPAEVEQICGAMIEASRREEEDAGDDASWGSGVLNRGGFRGYDRWLGGLEVTVVRVVSGE